MRYAVTSPISSSGVSTTGRFSRTTETDRVGADHDLFHEQSERLAEMLIAASH